jgi:signal peptidase I
VHRRWRAIAVLLLLLLAAVLGVGWVFVPYRVVGDSMAPTLLGTCNREGTSVAGDVVIVNRLAYVLSPPQRWDVVVLESLEGGRSGESVKRIAGLPGEEIEIRDGVCYADGIRRTPPARISWKGVVRKGPFSQGPLRLRRHQYFVLGDNSYASLDSRACGPVSRAQLRGQVWCVVLPWHRAGAVR